MRTIPFALALVLLTFLPSVAAEPDFRAAAEESRALLAELIAHATQRQFVHTHRWRANDLVIWDNRCTMHRGLPFDDQRWRRDAQRATVMDVMPTCDEEGIGAAAE